MSFGRYTKQDDALRNKCWLFAGSDLSSARSVSSPSPKSPIVDFEIPDADIALVTIPGTQITKRTNDETRNT